MSENDDRSRDDSELDVNPETLQDLEVAEDGDDPKGGRTGSYKPEDCTRTAC